MNFKFPSSSDLPQNLFKEPKGQNKKYAHSERALNRYDKGSSQDMADKTYSSNFYSQINFNDVNFILPISIQKTIIFGKINEI